MRGEVKSRVTWETEMAHTLRPGHGMTPPKHVDSVTMVSTGRFYLSIIAQALK